MSSRTLIFTCGVILATSSACGGGGAGGDGGGGGAGGGGIGGGTGGTVADPPAAPATVTATAGEIFVDVTWDAVADADSYNLYWTNDTMVPSRTYGTQIADVTSPFNHADLTAWLPYKYVITSVGEGGEGSESVAATAMPTSSVPLVAPTNVAIVSQSYRNRITWDAVPNATTYNVYWVFNTGQDPTKTFGYKTENTPNPYLHGPIDNGVEYKYVVAAKNPLEEGPLSDVVAGIPVIGGEVGDLTITFRLCCTIYSMGYALWIEDMDENYVATVAYYWAYDTWLNAVMPEWETKKGTHTDGSTHASAFAGEREQWTWDGLDHSNVQMPHGYYRVRLLINDWDNNQNYMNLTTADLELYDEAFTSSLNGGLDAAGNQLIDGGITFEYEP